MSTRIRAVLSSLFGLILCALSAVLVGAAPSAVTTLVATTNCQIQLQWNAPDNGGGGACGSYLVKYSTTADILNDTDFNNASTFSQSWPPLTPGAAEIKILTGLQPRTTHWFSIKASSYTTWSVLSSTGANACTANSYYIAVGTDSITGVGNCSLSWGDYDNDGDLDVAMAGFNGDLSPYSFSRVYRNDAGSFVNAAGTSITAVYYCSLSWGDYDNDGDLDLALAGTPDGTYRRSCVYRNDAGSFVNATGTSITEVYRCSLSWGDYDNDGDLDLAIAGATGSTTYISDVYRNDRATLVSTAGSNINADRYCSLSWGDYDNDGDLDLALSGNMYGSRVYRNDAGSFVNATGNDITGVYFCTLGWGDYDNDGDLDLALAGMSSFLTFYSRVYRNDAGSFINATGTDITGVTDCSLSWGDYNNDGYLDLALAGAYYNSGWQSFSRVYRNDVGSFVSVTGDSISGVQACSLSWGDYNNDGDLDLAISGEAEGSSIRLSRIYQSFEADFGNSNKDTRAPSAPSAGFDRWYSDVNKTLSLRWNKATDNGDGATPIDGLYYEIRMATETISDGLRKWIVSPSKGLGVGSGPSQNIGNYPHGYCVASSTQPGAVIKTTSTLVYWQVRTIDAGLRKSAWSVEQTYYALASETIPPGAISDLTALYGGPDTAILQWTAPGNDETNGDLGVGSKFRIKYSSVGIITAADFDTPPAAYAVRTIDISTAATALSTHRRTITGLTEGMYWFAIKTFDESLNRSAWNSSNDVASVNTLAWYGDTAPPGQVTGFTAVEGVQLQLTWTAPGDDEYAGNVTNGKWRIDYSSTTTTPGPNDSYTLVISSSFVQGAVYTRTITGLQPQARYYFQMIAYDGGGNWGTVWSNSASAVAGTFVDLGAGLTGVYNGALSWGDYDNDGDLDLALAGDNPTRFSCVYRNDAGRFVYANTVTYVGDGCSLSWGDYDNDGDLDLALAGRTGGPEYSRVYRNDAGSFVNATGADITGVYKCSLSWGDYDNDGDLDLALAGSGISRVYRNDPSSFFNATGTSITGMSFCSLSWGDYDNDGDLDLALAGYGGGPKISRVLRNDAGSFVNAVGDSITGVINCSLSWGDYDNDGDLDLAIAGELERYGEYTLWGIARIYRNDAGSFSNATGDSITGVAACSLSWGDYDNDGNLDLALAGEYYASYYNLCGLSRIYHNVAGSFVNATGDKITGVKNCALSWGDCDNDGDLDLALSGQAEGSSVYISRVYQSFEADHGNSNKDTRAPSAPATGFDAWYSYTKKTLSLRWVNATDNGIGATPVEGLYYEIRVATETLSDGLRKWVVSPSTGLGAGSSSSQNFGSYPHGYCVASSVQPGTLIISTNTLVGTTYYWQVRTIDAGLRRSAWSAPQSYGVAPQEFTPPAGISDLTALYIGINTAILHWTAPGDDGTNYNLSNGSIFRIQYSSVAIITAADFDSPPAEYAVSTIDISTTAAAQSQHSVTITGLTEGMYWFAIKTMDESENWSVWNSSADVSTVNTLAWCRDDIPPGQITGLTATVGAQVQLAWTAPGDDEYGGNVTDGAWRIDYSSSTTTPGPDVSLTLEIPGSFTQGESAYGCTITGLQPRAVYYFQIIARDRFGNWGTVWSDAASVMTGNLSELDAGLTGVSYSAVSWGDCDNDGDLDLALSGDGDDTITCVYRNDAGSFIDATGASISAVYEGGLSWGDYDNDGDLDLAVCGWGDDGGSARIYRNSAGTFEDTNAGLPGVDYSRLSWGDYDNDGDLDLALCGDGDAGEITCVYRNDPGGFINATGTSMIGVEEGGLSWGDYDNDGDLDLALSGDGDADTITCVYRNDAGSFIDATGASISAVYEGGLSWGDYDNDGDLDLAVCGWGDDGGSARIYRNSAGTFEDTNAGLPGVDYSRLSWGDYDNDGDLDLALCGYGDAGEITSVYRNDPGGFINATGTSMIGTERGDLSWGDYDSDSDLDLAIAGDSDDGYMSRIYKSLEADYGNSNSGSRAPNVPSGGLSTAFNTESETLNLRWNKVSDKGVGTTPADGMYYEVRMATEPISDQLRKWVISPSTGGGVGSGASQNIGNYPHGYCDGASLQPGLNVQPLMKDTTYYWQVRAIDTGLCKSAWSVQQSTYVPSTDMSEPGQVSGLSGVPGCQVVLSWTAPGDNGYAGTVTGGMWRIDYSSMTTTPGDTGGAGVYSRYIPADYKSGNTYSLVMTGLAPSAMYYFQMKARDDAGKWSTVWSGSASVIPGSFITASGTGLAEGYSGVLSWGDYDNDGDLDLAQVAENISRIYRNDGASFVTASGVSIDVVWAGALSWGDYDNDGDLDLAQSGYSYSQWQPISRIYRNDEGGIVDGGVTGMDGVYQSSLSWGDYDNDGDLDLALAGRTNGPYYSRVYRNDAGSFVNATDTNITGVINCSLSWGDYDNDGDLDLALAGDIGWPNSISRVYRNQAGSFVNATDNIITGVYQCSLSWGDYDNDGDLDLALAGYSNSDPYYISRVYRNDASSFVNASAATITGVFVCSLSWGDYDNDGDLDLALAGLGQEFSMSRVYRNDAGSFVNATGTGITGMQNCSLSWGDYDNDGDLDLALSGLTNTSETISRIYQSLAADYGTANAPPAPPSGMTATYAYDVAKSTIAFTWDPAQNDAGQSTHALYYQIVVTTNPTTWDGTKFTSPAKFIFPWQNGSPLMGAYVRPAAKVWPGASATKHAVLFTGDSTVLQPETTYYWRAQTIDAGLRGSAWSSEYTICASSADAIPPAGISNLTALATGFNSVTLCWTSPGDDEGDGSLDAAVFRIKYSSVGVITSAAFDAPPPELIANTIDIATTTAASSYQSIQLTALTADCVYWFAIKSVDNSGNWSVWNSSSDDASVNTQAYSYCVSANPGQVTGVIASSDAQVKLSWTAPGDNSYTGNVSNGLWRIDYSSATATPGDAVGAYTIFLSTSFTQGAIHSTVLTGLLPRTTYYFQVKARDDAGNWASAWSIAASAMAGAFRYGAINLTGVRDCSLSWGDYDNDGDLDLAVAGNSGSLISRVYRNDAGSFQDASGTGITGVADCSLSWGDCDNDGDLDLALSGNYGVGYLSRVYRNDGGSFINATGASITGVNDGSLSWGDYDNDGDLDLALSGYTGSSTITRVYRNDGGSYVNAMGTSITGVCDKGSLSWGDYDNDGDLDLALSGYQSPGANDFTCVYRNDAGTFANATGTSILKRHSGSLSWGDYDNDGDLDLALSGVLWTVSPYFFAHVYRNNGGSFTDATGSSITGVRWCSLSWGDYDNDGDLDLALAGYDGAINSSPIYINDKGSFVKDATAPLPGVQKCSLSWGDYEDDGDLDLALAGTIDGTNHISRIYTSLEAESGNSNIGSRAPSAPVAGLSTEYSTTTHHLMLRWDTAVDAGPGATPDNGLYYEIRMATEPISEGLKKWVITPSNGLGVGSGAQQRLGSYPHGYCVASSTQAGFNFKLPVPETTYYWQVRTMDAGLRKSDWSVEQSTWVPPDTWGPGKTLNVSADSGAQLLLRWTAPGNNEYTGAVTGGMWRIDYSSVTNTPGETGGSGVYSLYSATTNFAPGDSCSRVVTGLLPHATYYLQIKARDELGYWATVWSSSASAMAGSFVDDDDTSMPDVRNGSLAWGDYDNDGDLDLALSGNPSGAVYIARIYRNDAGRYAHILAGVTGVQNGALCWGDYDNDGDLDLAMTGDSGGGPVSRIYRNTANSFADIKASLAGVSWSAASWGDYDNDGDLDLALAGSGPSEYMTRVYVNEAGVFVPNTAGLTAAGYAALSWGDYDNDGDLDLALSGYTGSYISRIYRNDGGNFSDKAAGLTGTRMGSLSWGDYDNDGDLDLAICGTRDGTNHMTCVYQNSGGSFTNVTPALAGVCYSSLGWGDSDNDGDLDLAVAGMNTASLMLSRVYRNDLSGFSDSRSGLIGVQYAALNWGDHDNDGDLDLVVSGDTGAARDTRVYRSVEADSGNSNSAGRAPSTPSTGLQTSFSTATCTLSLQWDRTSDNGSGATPEHGLYYEVRMATEPVGGSVGRWIISPSIGRGTGSGPGQRLGSYPHGYSVASSTQPGLNVAPPVTGATYYWQVRSMDAGLRKSPWSVEQSTFVPAYAAAPGVVRGLTAATGLQALLRWTAPGDDGYSGTVTGGMWRIDYSTVTETPGETGGGSVYTLFTSTVDYFQGTPFAWTLTGLQASATYYFQIKARDGDGLWSEAWSSSASAVAGYFKDASAGLPGLSNSALSWGDYDNDGDLDLALSGDAGSSISISRVYRNDAGAFVDANVGLSGAYSGGLSWGDYDNDGDLDLAWCGYAVNNTQTRVYRNDAGSFVHATGNSLWGVRGVVGWGDYDNDGDLDLAVSGNGGYYTYHSRIYRNDAGTFANITAAILDANVSSVSWGDFDNDGDLDLALAGYNGSVRPARIYRNDAAHFVDIVAGLADAADGCLSWGDYDNDGDMDLAVAGYTGTTYRTRVYRNDAGSFVVGASATGVRDCSLAWGDYDNNGYLDLAFAGLYAASSYLTRVYANTAGEFTEINAGFPGIGNYCALGWGDYDDDGDLDLALTGGGAAPVTTVCASLLAQEGNSNSGDRAPSAPSTGFTTAYSTTTALFSFFWDKATDNGAGATGADGLYYEVRAATYPITGTMGAWSVNPGGSVGSGPGQRLGSYPHGYCIAASTQPGFHLASPQSMTTYYWQVRTVDAGLRASAWSVEQSTCVAGEAGAPGQVIGLSGVTGLQVALSWTAPGDDGYTGSVTNGAWDIAYSSVTETPGDTGGASVQIYNSPPASFIPGAQYALTLTCLLPRVTYYFQMKAVDDSGNTSAAWSNAASAVAGSFVDINAGMIWFTIGDMSWGDYDNDGDLDMALSGYINGTGVDTTRIYRNDAGSFVDINASMVGTDYCSISWGDYDNDGDLDLALSGYADTAADTNFIASLVYRNDNGGFVDGKAGLPALCDSALSWGDYDNDGDVDLVLCGYNIGGEADIYRNDSGRFARLDVGLTGVDLGSVSWGDYDNDGDLDIALNGNPDAGSTFTRVYRNDYTRFVDVQAGLSGVFDGSITWGDYDNDGDLDLAYCGYGSGYVSAVYRNDAGSFENINAGLAPVYEGSVAWGDYDNDGYMELGLSGWGGQDITRLYRRAGESFTAVTSGLYDAQQSPMAWGDYDNDGDLDLAMAGYTNIGYRNLSTIYQSCEAAYGPNPCPGEPLSGFLSTYSPATHALALRWDTATDTGPGATAQNGLYYELRMATEPVTGAVNRWVIATSSGLGVGSSENQRLGTYPHGYCEPATLQPGVTLNSPACGATYYWQVRAMDAGLRTSPWSAMQSIYIPLEVIPPGAVTGLSAATGLQMSLTWTSPGDDGYVGTVTGGMWHIAYSSVTATPGETGGDTVSALFQEASFVPGTPCSLTMTGLAPLVTYYFQIKARDGGGNWAMAWSSAASACAGVYGDLNAGLSAVSSGGLSWGDYDNDGDLDLAVSGRDLSWLNTSCVYRNDGGTFVNATGTEIPGVRLCSLSWGDYDNDGDLDLALAGFQRYGNGIARVYRNDAGSFVNATGASITGVYNGALSWGDYDNDGDLDLALAGYGGGSRVYRNDGGAFSNVTGDGITGVYYCSLGWGDCDSDGDLDLALAGTYDGTNNISRIYANNEGIFEITDSALESVRESSLAWGDYDNDGDIDLLLTGYTGSAGLSRIYRNDALGFVDSGVALTGMWRSAVAWCDIDNDGAIDIALAGNAGAAYRSTILRNDAGSYSDCQAHLPGVQYASLAWGDYDADGDPDLALSGDAGETIVSNIYRSFKAEYGAINATPSAPAGMTAKYTSRDDRGGIQFSWDPGAYDTGQSQHALYYQIVVATCPTTWDGTRLTGPARFAIPWQSGSPLMGAHIRPSAQVWPGGTHPQHAQFLAADNADLQPGTTYYWRAQTIDAGLRRSPWSAEYTLCASADDITPPAAVSNLTALSGGANAVTLSWTSPGDDGAIGVLASALFRIRYSTAGIITGENFDAPPAGYAVTTVDISTTTTALSCQTKTIGNLLTGVTYWFAIKTMDSTGNWSVWRSSADVPTVNTLAWSYAESASPGQITGFAAAAGTQVSLTWTAPGDNGYTGNVTDGMWRIDYSSTTTTPGQDDSYTLEISSSFTQGATTYGCMITGLQPRTAYYFQMIARDEAGNWGTVWSDSASALSGSFVDIGAGLTGVDKCFLSWGDYDNDGDLDLALAGTLLSRVYRNHNGSFINSTGDSITGLRFGSLSWGDYDNDGDLDLALAGHDGTAPKTLVYRNEQSSFTNMSFGSLAGVWLCSLGWGDYDNDGDLDLALSGSGSAGARSRIYRNDNSSFVDTEEFSITQVNNCSLSWGDYDNDGDLDLALAGGMISRVYSNNGGSFVNATGASITGVQRSCLSWGDYDNDGDLDLALAGDDGSGYLSCVYRNDGGSLINATGTSLTGVWWGSLSWGDYDNDGDFDLALAGWSGAGRVSCVYRNDDASFVNAGDGNITSVGYYNCSIGWGDYDSDGDLDLALAGNSISGNISRIYKSLEADYGNANKDSRAPSIPAPVLSAGYDAYREMLTLRWDPAMDNGPGATPANGLYYEVRMATEPISDGLVKWVISPSTGLGVGSSSSQNIGNYPHGYCVASGTQPGVNIRPTALDCTYYWQVRAIDAGLCKSGWSTIQSTYVPVDTMAPGVPTGLTAEMSAQVTLSWTAPGDNGYLGHVVGGMWRIDYSSTVMPTPGVTGGAGVNTWYSAADFVPGDLCSTVMTGLHPGVPYYFQIQARDDTGKWSGWSSFASAVPGTIFDNDQGDMPGVYNSYLSWGDYDNDGDLDLALAGDSGSGYLSRVYRNDAGSFINATGAAITGVWIGSLSWGDYDNDGDLDLALTGYSSVGLTRVYRNDAVGFVNATGDSITGVYRSSLGWGDYDNDGDLDLALAGTADGTAGLSCVYRNDVGSFSNATAASMTGVYRGSLSWGDYDNDGDLDLALAGMNASEKLSRVYRNDAGSFVNATGASMTGIGTYSSLSWGDYDNDGDLDLAMAGSAISSTSRVYRNDALSFVNASGDSITGVCYCSLSWGDYDSDGDLDLALAGTIDGSIHASRIYRNDALSFINATGVGITAVGYCSLSWGDYDSDGDLDLALSGQKNAVENITRLYQSLEADYGNANTGARLPSEPSAGLSAAFDSLNRRISLQWNRSTDNGAGATPQNGLSYEIRVSTQAWATTPDSVTKWYVSPSTGVGVGSASSQNLGNYPHGYCDPATLQPGVNLTTLAYDATYYWQVRTIDAGLGKSPWSAVQSRYVPAVDMIGPAGISNLTALYGGSCAITLNWTAPGTDGLSGDLAAGSSFRIKYSTVGILTAALFDAPPANYAATTVNVATTAVAGSAQSLTLTGLTPAATCWFAVKTMDAWGNWSVWHSSADVASVNTLAWRAVVSLPPAPVTDLSAAPAVAEGAVALTWTSPHENNDGTGGSVTRYTVRHATFSASSLSGGATAWWAHPGVTAGLVISSASINAPGVTETGIVASLAPGVTYYFGIVSDDALAGVSDIDVRAYTAQAIAAARDLPPDPPTGLAAVSVSTYSISLAWDVMSGCTGYMDFSYYALYRSTAGAAMALVSTTTFTVYVDTAVIVDTTYYYQLNAVDSEPSVLSGGMGPILAVCMPAAPVFNSAVPRAPSGIKLESTRAVRTIRWSPVRYNSDGKPSTNLAWYAVYRSNDPRGGWTLAGTTDTCAWNDTTPMTGTWYYTVRAVTTDGVESADSLLCDTAFNILAISDDSRVLLTIPSTVASPLYQGQVCDEDVNVVVTPVDAQPALTAVAVYDIRALNAQTDEEVAAFRFAKTRAKLTYFCQDAAAPQDADNLAFSWFNGVEWVRVGTEQEGASIVTMTSRLGTYAVRETMRATTFTLYSVYPRTFTPNGDNRNDHVEFQYDNPRDAFVVGKIYDKAGALVTELREGVQMDSLMWDGTTSKGTRARPGAYVYQIEVTGSESKVINGIVVVAR